MKREPKQPWRCRMCPWQARGSRVVQVVAQDTLFAGTA